MNQLSVLPVHSPSTMSPDEARWAAFLGAAGMPYQYKPLMFTELGTGATLSRHAPSFLIQCRKPFWLEVLPALEADDLPAYDEVLHFARTIVMVHELERSEYWPGSVFAAFGRPGSAQGKYSGTYRSNENPKPTTFALGCYIWAECTFCHRVTLCVDYGHSIGDWTGSVAMSCCGQIFDHEPANRPVRSSKKLRRAAAAANRVIVPNKG
jgi:hypothetical protein